MSSIFALQYWLIIFLMAGLTGTRRYVGRYVIGVVTFAIARFFVRSVVYSIEGRLDHNFSDWLNNDWLILFINFVVIYVLFSEMVTGTKCWRIWKIQRRKHKRNQGHGPPIPGPVDSTDSGRWWRDREGIARKERRRKGN